MEVSGRIYNLLGDVRMTLTRKGLPGHTINKRINDLLVEFPFARIHVYDGMLPDAALFKQLLFEELNSLYWDVRACVRDEDRDSYTGIMDAWPHFDIKFRSDDAACPATKWVSCDEKDKQIKQTLKTLFDDILEAPSLCTNGALLKRVHMVLKEFPNYTVYLNKPPPSVIAKRLEEESKGAAQKKVWG